MTEVAETDFQLRINGQASPGHQSPDPDVPIPSIEHDTSSPDHSSEASDTSIDESRSLTLYSFNQPHSPSPDASPLALVRAPVAASRGSTARSLGRELQHMTLSDRNGIANLGNLEQALVRVERGSDSRAASLAPDDAYAVRHGTPRRRARSLRLSPRVEPPKHRVEDEEPPQDVFNSPSFQQAFRDAKQLMADIHQELGRSSGQQDPDSTMQRLRREAEELADFSHPSTRIVGFVGDSGAGKSSVLNCLLDHEQLARTGGNGQACTCVVTEYHYHAGSTFDVEVDLFSQQEINDQLATMLADYRNFHLNINDERGSEEDARRALDTFNSMFSDQLGHVGFLLGRSERNILEALRSWAAAARPSDIDSHQSFSSLADCSAYLTRISSELPSIDELAKWPFIRKVKVFLNAHILSKGLVLVDLPGLRDVNLARRSITERFLLEECDEIFVVCSIIRAVSDESVEEIFRLARTASLSNVSIVCTRSDDINAGEAKRDWIEERASHIEDLQNRIDAETQELHEIDEEILGLIMDETNLSLSDRDDLLSLQSDGNGLRKSIRDHEAELHSYLVTTRNVDIKRDLQARYRKPDSDEPVEVFCVSKIDYWNNRQKDKDAALPGLQLSGILELRRYCISIVANGQHRAATLYIKDRIPALLAQIELWVQSGVRTPDSERREMIRQNLEAIKQRLKEDLDHHRSSVRRVSRHLKSDFDEQIYRQRDISGWSQAAARAGREWAYWSHGSYTAFCRKNGKWATEAVGDRNWNEEVIRKMADDLGTPWIALQTRIQSRQEGLERVLDALLNWALEHIESGLSSVSEIMGPLINGLIAQKEILWSRVERNFEAFRAGLKLLRTDSMTGLETSLITIALGPTYKACLDNDGRGSHKKRTDIMNRTLQDESLFEDLMTLVRQRFGGLALDAQTRMDEAVASFLQNVHLTLEIVLSDNIALESEQDPGFRLVVQEAVNRGNEEIRRIGDVITA